MAPVVVVAASVVRAETGLPAGVRASVAVAREVVDLGAAAATGASAPSVRSDLTVTVSAAVVSMVTVSAVVARAVAAGVATASVAVAPVVGMVSGAALIAVGAIKRKSVPLALGRSGPASREERIEARCNEPKLPDDVRADELDPSVRQDLKSLSKDNADRVARHMIMAAMLLSDLTEAGTRARSRR